MNSEEFDRHLISYHDGGDDYRYCFSKQEADTIKNALNGYDKAIDDVISMLNNMKLDIYSKEILSAVNATISLIVADVKQLKRYGFLEGNRNG